MEQIGTDLKALRKDVEIIKRALFFEGELSDWAKRTLQKARQESEDSYASLDEL